jgi:hypothetical protein
MELQSLMAVIWNLSVRDANRRTCMAAYSGKKEPEMGIE